MFLTHIITTHSEESTVVYPDGLFVRVRSATSAATPVPWRIVSSQHGETVGAILLPTTSSSRLINSNSK
eukprot:3819407-Amphidinium_carterae.1